MRRDSAKPCRGALVVTADGAEPVPAFVVDVVDTTGCGDAFSAGYLRAKRNRMGHKLPEDLDSGFGGEFADSIGISDPEPVRRGSEAARRNGR